MRTVLKLSFSLGILILLNSCGKGLEGTYTGQRNAFFDQLTFTSGSTVELMFMGATKEAHYNVKNKKVRINSADETQVFTINEDGCLEGGGYLGTYCKN